MERRLRGDKNYLHFTLYVNSNVLVKYCVSVT